MSATLEESKADEKCLICAKDLEVKALGTVGLQVGFKEFYNGGRT